MKRLLFVLCLAAIVLPVLPIFAQDGLNPEAQASLQTVMDDAVAAGTPGIVIWIDSPLGNFEGAVGYADLEAEILMQTTDSFRVGSITKTFTSTVILQLMEEGVLDLDDTLEEWLPDVAATLQYADQITLRHLLNHTSGIFDYLDDEVVLQGFIDDEDIRQHEWTSEEMVAVAASHEPNFAPGEEWYYTNTNYVLLTMIIEVATGKSLVENYHERIFDPLQLDNTYFANVEEPIGTLVHGYSDYLETDGFNTSWLSGAGGIVSNAPDIITFARALMGGQLFNDPATLDIMKTPSAVSLEMSMDGSDYALGLSHLASPFGDIYSHDGFAFGYNTMMVYVADYDIVFILFSNADESQADLGGVLQAFGQMIEASSN